MARRATSVPAPAEWCETANVAAQNLGVAKHLRDLPAEHWQLVLISVEDRMRLRGVTPPLGWRRTLGRQVGRRDNSSSQAGVVTALRRKREEIAAQVALELGLGA